MKIMVVLVDRRINVFFQAGKHYLDEKYLTVIAGLCDLIDSAHPATLFLPRNIEDYIYIYIIFSFGTKVPSS